MAVVFINLTQHALTEEQKKAAVDRFGITEFKELKEMNSLLFNELANSPSDETKIRRLVESFISWMVSESQKVYGVSFFHFSIGSPAFNFRLAGELYNCNEFKGNILFSHSERVSKEVVLPDGSVKKESLFVFKKFIQF